MPLHLDVFALRDLDLIGEVLRHHVFLPDQSGNDLGCYSTFELRHEFAPVDRTSPLGQEMIRRLLGPSFREDPSEIEQTQLYSDGRIHVGWHWDGDGCLLFMVDHLALINTDCKKSYGWGLEMPHGVIDVADLVHGRLSAHQRLAATRDACFGFLNRLLIALAPLVTLEKFNDLRHQATEAIDDLKRTLVLTDREAAQVHIANRIVGDLARVAAKYSKARELPKIRQAHDALVLCLDERSDRTIA